MDIIEKAREIGKAIQSDSRYIRLDIAKTANDNDSELQMLIGEFNLKRLALNEEASKENPDEKKIDDLNKSCMDVYTAIMDKPSMKEYNSAREELDKLVNFIGTIITGSANGEDPDLIQEHKSSCGGDCSGCSGCH